MESSGAARARRTRGERARRRDRAERAAAEAALDGEPLLGGQARVVPPAAGGDGHGELRLRRRAARLLQLREQRAAARREVRRAAGVALGRQRGRERAGGDLGAAAGRAEDERRVALGRRLGDERDEAVGVGARPQRGCDDALGLEELSRVKGGRRGRGRGAGGCVGPAPRRFGGGGGRGAGGRRRGRRARRAGFRRGRQLARQLPVDAPLGDDALRERHRAPVGREERGAEPGGDVVERACAAKAGGG
jgi:hypothetical protein